MNFVLVRLTNAIFSIGHAIFMLPQNKILITTGRSTVAIHDADARTVRAESLVRFALPSRKIPLRWLPSLRAQFLAPSFPTDVDHRVGEAAASSQESGAIRAELRFFLVTPGTRTGFEKPLQLRRKHVGIALTLARGPEPRLEAV